MDSPLDSQFLAAAKETARRSSVAVANFTKAVDERNQRLSNLLNDLTLKMCAYSARFYNLWII